MNRKIKGFLSVLALAAVSFAQAPAVAQASGATVAPAPEAAAAYAAAPAPETAAPVAENPAGEASEALTAQAATGAPPAEATSLAEEAAPVAVRGTGAAPAQESPETPVTTATPEPVQEPAVAVAPRAVRGADKDPQAVERFRDARNTVYYETVYTREDGVPVRTVYVAQREGKDTVSMEKLMGLVPMQFKIGAHASIGSYYMLSNDWDGDSYSGMNWRGGLMAILPLNEYTMGVKLGVLYEQSDASESYYINGIPYSFKFKQKKIDIPVMFTFKAASSRIYFDLGAQLTVPLYDKLKYSYTSSQNGKSSSRIDMIDEDFRNSIDWSFLFGFSVMVHKHISLDVGADIGLSNLYDGHIKYMDLGLSASSFNIGLTLYPF